MPARLEDLTPGAMVTGVVPGETAVAVVAAEWHGTACVTVTYRTTDGSVGQRLVFRADESRLEVAGSPNGQGTSVMTWTFDADGDLFRLVAEARRIRLAHLFDPRLAVHLSLLEPLPHQIQAVYGELLPRHPLRFALCDDPGAGKTIMAGLYLKELLLRGDVRRCLIVAPGGLVTQWQDEMADRFGLRFSILTRDMIEASRTVGDPFAEHDLLIARLDHLARNDDLVERLRHTEWDLAIVDEAHRMSARYFGNELKETKRYRLGKVLGQSARHLLLMTATPHAGKEEDFHLFLALLDPDRFEGRNREASTNAPARAVDVSDLLRRMVKEKLLRFDGRPLFPERRATTVAYPLSPKEAELYAEVTAYVADEMNRADRLSAEGEGRRGNRVGFAVTVLQRRLASSPEAIYQSLRRRRTRLEERRDEQARPQPAAPIADAGPAVDLEDIEDLDEAEVEALEAEVVDEATAARTLAELDAEITTVRRLESLAEVVRSAGDDRKWNELAGLLDAHPDKLIVFTEHRDTLNYLAAKLRRFFGRSDAVTEIHGGVAREERRRRQELFTQDKDCRVLVATDAAGEGINLQRAHLLVNYDLPWNPNRIEQRFGRVHRIGQTEVCHLWNLVAEDTREGQVYLRLLDKLEEQRRALGGQVFDVLGAALPGRALRDLLIEAIRYGDRPEVRARLHAVVDERVGDGLAELVEEQALASDLLDAADVERIRRDLLEAEARRLQPHYIRSWFLDAFERLGGRVVEREPGRYEVTRVPEPVRARPPRIGGAVLPRYERITFEKALVGIDGRAVAELVAPGHPLLEAVLDLTVERHESVLRRGALLVDEADPSVQVRVLLLLSHDVVDGRGLASRRFEFVELTSDGVARVAGYAPYLDYRPATAEEAAVLSTTIEEAWLRDGVERLGLDHAIDVSVPAHLDEVRRRTEARVAKVRAAVRERLTKQIAYWDRRAGELRHQADAGRQPRMNPERAQARADELAERLERRSHELDREGQLSALPPVMVGAAIVVPAGALALRVSAPAPHALATANEETERRAVDAVLAAERSLAHRPVELARNHPGYDIRSELPDGTFRFLEVKGRVAGADTFFVTRNEILHALNVPDAWVLALVEVAADGASGDVVRYLDRPFGDTVHLPFATTATALSWPDYWRRGRAPA